MRPGSRGQRWTELARSRRCFRKLFESLGWLTQKRLFADEWRIVAPHGPLVGRRVADWLLPPIARCKYRATMRSLTRLQWVLVGIVALVVLACLGGLVNAIAGPTPASNTGRSIPGPTTTGPTEIVGPITATSTVPLPTFTPPPPTTTNAPTATPKPTSKPTTHKPAPKPTTHKPTPTSHPTVSGFVHPGAFCSQHYAYGFTDKGTLMQCKPSATDSRFRWRAA